MKSLKIGHHVKKQFLRYPTNHSKKWRNERYHLASKNPETGELSYDSLNLTGSISRYNTKDGRTRSSHPGWEEGTM